MPRRIVQAALTINHSCEANAEVDLGVDEHWAKVYAWRDIAAGEEITCDSEFPPELAEPCSCGASKVQRGQPASRHTRDPATAPSFEALCDRLGAPSV